MTARNRYGDATRCPKLQGWLRCNQTYGHAGRCTFVREGFYTQRRFRKDRKR